MISSDLRSIDFRELDMSEYSRKYILRLMPSLDYYLAIYSRCIDRMMDKLGLPEKDITVVDYGGGHGFLSCLLKKRGFGRVIYVDFNPQAVQAVEAVSRALGYGPDVMIQGGSSQLRSWCEEQGEKPQALLGMDVIEHIYRLEPFFADLHSINPEMEMIFTTGSTPFNPMVRRRLQRVMLSDEKGPNGFYAQRRRHIAAHFPEMEETELDRWAEQTRGLVFADAIDAVKKGTPNLVSDAYNTCDPATGSWTERILPMEDYRNMLAPLNYQVDVANGFYNTYRAGTKRIPSLVLNGVISTLGLRMLAPFITLIVSPSNKEMWNLLNSPK